MKTKLLIAALVIVIGGSGLVLYSRLSPAPAADDSQWLNALGTGAAAETAKLLGGQGRIVVATGGPATDRTLAATLKAFRKDRRLTVVNTVALPTPATDLGELMETHAAADALVVFQGGTVLQPKNWPPKPLLVLVKPVTADLVELLRAKVVALAIVPQLPPKPGTPRTDREWFDAYYQAVTPATVAILAPEEPQ